MSQCPTKTTSNSTIAASAAASWSQHGKKKGIARTQVKLPSHGDLLLDSSFAILVHGQTKKISNHLFKEFKLAISQHAILLKCYQSYLVSNRTRALSQERHNLIS